MSPDGPDGLDDFGFETDDELEEEWLTELDEAERDAVDVLRAALRRFRRRCRQRKS